MSLKRSLGNPWLIRITLIISIASCIAAGVLLTQIDNLVNGKLYQYGLQFSYAWADSYWASIRMAFALLGVSIALIFVSLAVMFSKNVNQLGTSQSKKIAPLLPLRDASKGLRLEEHSVAETSFNEPEARSDRKIQHQDEATKINNAKENISTKDNGTQGLACPNCHKISSRPLVMLDFAEGKTKLVNVCPYCNFTLGEVDNQEKNGDRVHVGSGEKVKQKT